MDCTQEDLVASIERCQGTPLNYYGRKIKNVICICKYHYDGYCCRVHMDCTQEDLVASIERCQGTPLNYYGRKIKNVICICKYHYDGYC